MSVDFVEEWAAVGVATWKSLLDLYDEIGYTDDERAEEAQKLFETITDFCQDQIEAATQARDDSLAIFEEKQQEIQHLCTILGKPPAKQSIDETDSIRNKIQSLESLHTQLNELRLRRQEQIDELRNQICELGLQLDEQMTAADENGSPAALGESMIQSLQKQLAAFKQLISTRTETIKELSEQCYKKMKYMCIEPSNTSNPTTNTLVQSFALNQTFGFPLHESTITDLRSCYEEFANEETRRKSVLTDLGAQIGRLWSVLEVSESDRAEFQNSFTDHLSLSTIHAGELELARLHELKRQNMDKILGRVRQEIAECWLELGASTPAQQEEFPMYFTDLSDLDESALAEHEAYVQGLQHRLDALRPLLAKVHKRESYIDDRLEYEKLIMNPERLMARGPNASKMRKREEEMGKRVKQLKKIDDDVVRAVTTWQEQNNQVFYFRGISYFHRMQAQQRQYDAYKLMLRNVSKERRKTDKDTLVGTTRVSSHSSSTSLNSSGSGFELPEPPLLDNFYDDSMFELPIDHHNESSVDMIGMQLETSFSTQASYFNQENIPDQGDASTRVVGAAKQHGGLRPSAAHSDTTEPTVVAERL